MNDLIDLMEWNQFAEDRKTLLEALTILNNRHREVVGKLEIERDELLAALSGRTVSCGQCNTLAAENQAMREAIREAESTFGKLKDKEWFDGVKPGKVVCVLDAASLRSLLAKLQPFLK
jgi:hypothetical protein